MSREFMDSIYFRIEDQMSEVTFLSEILLEDDDVTRLLRQIERIFEFSGTYVNMFKFDLLASFLLVHIGLKGYDEGNYWSGVKNELASGGLKQNRLGKMFRRVLREYDLPLVEETGRVNVNNILMHTVVPEKYQNSFFEFLFRFYREKLGYELGDDLDDMLEQLANHFQSELEGAVEMDGDFSIGSYALLKPTKMALADDTFAGPFLKKLLTVIDAHYYQEELPEQLSASRFQQPLATWLNENVKERKKRNFAVVRRSRNPHLQLRDDGLFLVIPPRRMLSGAEHVIRIEGGIDEGNIPLRSFSTGAGRETRKEVKLLRGLGLSPFKRFDLHLGGKTIFSNPGNRYLLFNAEGKQMSGAIIGWNKILLSPGVDLRSSARIHQSDLGGEYYLYHVFLTDGDSLIVDGDPLKLKEEGGFRYADFPEHYASCGPSERESRFEVEHPVIFLPRTSLPNGAHLEMEYRNDIRRFRLSDFLNSAQEDEVLTIDVGTLAEDCLLGECRLRLVHTMGSEDILSPYYIVKGFRYEFSREKGYSASGHVTINSDFAPTATYEWTGDEFEFELGHRGEHVRITIPTPLMQYCLGDDSWMPRDENRPVWYQDIIGDNIEVRRHGAKKMNLYVSIHKPGGKSKRMETIKGVARGGSFSFNIAEVRRMIDENPRWKFVFDVSYDGRQRRKIMNLVTHLDYHIEARDGEFAVVVSSHGFFENARPEVRFLNEAHLLSDGENIFSRVDNQRLRLEIHERHRQYFFNEKMKKIESQIIGSSVWVEPPKRKSSRTKVYYNEQSIELENSLIRDGAIDEEQAKKKYDLIVRFSTWLNEDIFWKMLEALRNFLSTKE